MQWDFSQGHVKKTTWRHIIIKLLKPSDKKIFKKTRVNMTYRWIYKWQQTIMQARDGVISTKFWKKHYQYRVLYLVKICQKLIQNKDLLWLMTVERIHCQQAYTMKTVSGSLSCRRTRILYENFNLYKWVKCSRDGKHVVKYNLLFPSVLKFL